MTDTKQPEALRLALSIDVMDTFTNYQQEELEKAAAELRRLHARIVELEAQLSSSGFTAADMATAAAQGFRDGVASVVASAGSGPVAWPKDATEVREFFNSDFISAQFAAPDQSPCDEDRYYISAHDFLSAINWWADFPHHPSPPEGMVMVPKEPTHHMINAAASAYKDARQSLGAYNAPWAAYRAMLEVSTQLTSSADSGKEE